MSNLVLDESSMNREASRGYSWWFSGDAFERQAAQDHRPPSRNLSAKLWSHPGRLTILYFFALIALATVLLELPISAHNRMVTDPVVAFFTAVSAASTCGIQVVNTTTHWSLFGQAVILLAVQFGGLGVMTFASLIALAVNKHIKASQRMLTARELGATKLSETKGVLNAVLVTTLLIEVITFLALFPGLLHVNHGNVRHALWEALFFAVISYNNAGFTPDGAGLHVNSWGVGLPVLLSAFCGTLGFPVLLNLMRAARKHTPPKRWTLHTKITLIGTFCMVAVSLLWFRCVEWNNHILFSHADLQTRLRYALTAAVMPRTSGFDPSWVPDVSDPTKVFMSAFMFIGGGSTSTAGGIRVTTFTVVLLVCRAAFRGKRDVTVFHKRINERTTMTAVSIMTTCLILVFTVSLALMAVSGCSLSNALFDTCSAFGLGGYTVGVADQSDPAALLLLAMTMVIGRIGPMTIAYAINRPSEAQAVRFPEEPIIVG